MTTDGKLQFVLGCSYQNDNGSYTVLSIEPPLMRVRYQTGELALLNISIQERIQQRLVAQSAPSPAPNPSSPSSLIRQQPRGSGASIVGTPPAPTSLRHDGPRHTEEVPPNRMPPAGMASGVRVIAIDWSGDVTAARRKIWLAEVVAAELVRLENGRSPVQQRMPVELVIRQSCGAPVRS